MADTRVTVDTDQVLVTAIKPAHRGPGLVVRLANYSTCANEARLRSTLAPLRAARLCDARERDLGELLVEDGEFVVPLSGAIVSVRLLF